MVLIAVKSHDFHQLRWFFESDCRKHLWRGLTVATKIFKFVIRATVLMVCLRLWPHPTGVLPVVSSWAFEDEYDARLVRSRQFRMRPICVRFRRIVPTEIVSERGSFGDPEEHEGNSSVTTYSGSIDDHEEPDEMLQNGRNEHDATSTSREPEAPGQESRLHSDPVVNAVMCELIEEGRGRYQDMLEEMSSDIRARLVLLDPNDRVERKRLFDEFVHNMHEIALMQEHEVAEGLIREGYA